MAAEVGIGHITTDQQRFAAFGLDYLLRGLGVLVLVEIHDGHIGAFAGEMHRGGAADAAVSSGHDGDQILHLGATAIVGMHEFGRRDHLAFNAGLTVLLLRRNLFCHDGHAPCH